MKDMFGDNSEMFEGALYVQQRVSSPIAILYAGFIIFLLVAFLLQRTLLKILWYLIAKSLRLCCFCLFKKSDEENIIREEQ